MKNYITFYVFFELFILWLCVAMLAGDGCVKWLYRRSNTLRCVLSGFPTFHTITGMMMIIMIIEVIIKMMIMMRLKAFLLASIKWRNGRLLGNLWEFHYITSSHFLRHVSYEKIPPRQDKGKQTAFKRQLNSSNLTSNSLCNTQISFHTASKELRREQHAMDWAYSFIFNRATPKT